MGHHITPFNLCSALMGVADGIFSSRYSMEADPSPGALNWDEQTSQHHRKIAWHSSSTATPRVLSATVDPPTTQQASQLTQGLSDWPLLYQASKESQRHSDSSSSTSSAMQHDCCNIKRRWTICQRVFLQQVSPPCGALSEVRRDDVLKTHPLASQETVTHTSIKVNCGAIKPRWRVGFCSRMKAAVCSWTACLNDSCRRTKHEHKSYLICLSGWEIKNEACDDKPRVVPNSSRFFLHAQWNTWGFHQYSRHSTINKLNPLKSTYGL